LLAGLIGTRVVQQTLQAPAQRLGRRDVGRADHRDGPLLLGQLCPELRVGLDLRPQPFGVARRQGAVGQPRERALRVRRFWGVAIGHLVIHSV
jgi:hypothetical protein